MGRIIGIDYGLKKTGISVTDPLQIIVTPIKTVMTSELYPFLKDYFINENVDKVVIGDPKHRDGASTYLREYIDVFIQALKKDYPNIEVDLQDERMTSIEAKNIILQSGIRKSKRRDKTLVDKISAVLILQKYLGHI